MIKLPRTIRRTWKRSNRALREGVVQNSPPWLRERMGPAGAFLDMLLVDHGLLRYAYLNKHQLAPDAWRAAQPAPYHIRRFARDGIKTVVNLRGERLCGAFYLETEACQAAGIRLVNFAIRSRAAPSREELTAARDLIQSIEYPALFHCKSGADRAGLMAVLFRHVRLGEPIETAKRELSLAYGHIRQADTGILDYFFERYLDNNRTRPMAFFEWVETVYDPVELKTSFHASGWANRIVNGVLRRE